MGDSITIKFDTSAVTAGFEQSIARMDSVTKYALRDLGRVVSRSAKKGVKNYRGSDPRAVKGLLKKQIKSSRNITTEAGYLRLTVGPRGGRVNLYAQKIEADRHFMAGAEAVAHAEAQKVFERQWERAINRAFKRRYGTLGE